MPNPGAAPFMQCNIGKGPMVRDKSGHWDLTPAATNGNTAALTSGRRGDNARRTGQVNSGGSRENFCVVAEALERARLLSNLPNDGMAGAGLRCRYQSACTRRPDGRITSFSDNFGVMSDLQSYAHVQCSNHWACPNIRSFSRSNFGASSSGGGQWIRIIPRHSETLFLARQCDPDTWGAQ